MERDKILKKSLLYLIIINISLILFAVIYTAIFTLRESQGKEMACIFKENIHLYCPGCGGSRSLREFLRFNFISSFILYPPITISALIMIYHDIRQVYAIVKKDISYISNAKYYYFIIIPICTIVFFFLRNILLICFKIDLIGDFLS